MPGSKAWERKMKAKTAASVEAHRKLHEPTPLAKKIMEDSTGARFVELHPNLPEAHKKAILSRTLIVGLNWEEAFAIEGIHPVRKSDGEGGKWEMWTNGRKTYLFFENDRLVRWETL